MLDDKLLEDKAWQQMRNLLDEEMPQKKGFLFWKKWFVIVPFFFFLIGGGYVIWTNLSSGLDSDNKQISDSYISQLSEQKENYKQLDNQEANVKEWNNSTKQNQSYLTKGSSNLKSSNNSTTNEIKFSKNNKTSNHPLTNLENNLTNNILSNPANSIRISNESKKFNTANGFISFDEIEEEKENEIKNLTNNFNPELDNEKVDNVDVPKRQLINEDGLMLPNVDLIYAQNTELPNLNVSPSNSLKFGLYGISGINYISDFHSTSYYGGLMGEMCKVNSSWSLNIGLTYEYINLRKPEYLFSSQLDANVVEEGTGVGSFADADNSLQLSRIQMLNIPIYGSYKYKGWKFGIGLNNALVLGETITEDLEDGRMVSVTNFINNNQSSINNIYRLGLIKSIDYRFNSKFSAGIRFRYDLTQFNTVTNSSNNRLHSIGLQAAYKLF